MTCYCLTYCLPDVPPWRSGFQHMSFRVSVLSYSSCDPQTSCFCPAASKVLTHPTVRPKSRLHNLWCHLSRMWVRQTEGLVRSWSTCQLQMGEISCAAQFQDTVAGKAKDRKSPSQEERSSRSPKDQMPLFMKYLVWLCALFSRPLDLCYLHVHGFGQQASCSSWARFSWQQYTCASSGHISGLPMHHSFTVDFV